MGPLNYFVAGATNIISQWGVYGVSGSGLFALLGAEARYTPASGSGLFAVAVS
jgi:hypothetical protein